MVVPTRGGLGVLAGFFLRSQRIDGPVEAAADSVSGSDSQEPSVLVDHGSEGHFLRATFALLAGRTTGGLDSGVATIDHGTSFMGQE